MKAIFQGAVIAFVDVHCYYQIVVGDIPKRTKSLFADIYIDTEDGDHIHCQTQIHESKRTDIERFFDVLLKTSVESVIVDIDMEGLPSTFIAYKGRDEDGKVFEAFLP